MQPADRARFAIPSGAIRAARTACRFVAVAAIVHLGLACSETKAPAPKILPKYRVLPPRTGLPPFMKNTIFERTETTNTDPLLASNYSLVVNLDGTGDSTAPTSVRQYIMNEMAKRGFGNPRNTLSDKLDPQQVLLDKRVAIVRVDALLPAGARKGQMIDAQVSALDTGGNTTSSLAHGRLYSCDLTRGGADPRSPGSEVGIQASVADSPVWVNPAYALSAPTSAAAKASLRYGVVMGRTRIMQDRSIILRVRNPQLSLSRVIEARVNQRMQQIGVARAFDEGLVQLFVPESFHGDWEHFVGLVTHLYLQDSTEFNVVMAKKLADAAMEPGAKLMDISYAWEGLNKDALPIIIPLMGNTAPDVAFAAARAAAFIGDSSAQQVLLEMARTPHHPFQLNAVEVLGDLPPSPSVNLMLRSLMDGDDNLLRIAAYRVLAQNQDSSIYSQLIPGGDPAAAKFILDIVPSNGKPFIYAFQRGLPRIAVFGGKPALNLPILYTAFDNRLSISTAPDQRNVTLFYRGHELEKPIQVLSKPDVAELIARLGGEGPIDESNFDMNYADIVAVLQGLARGQNISAVASAEDHTPVPTPFILQELPQAQNSIYDAPPIPDQPRPQADATPSPTLDTLSAVPGARQ